MKKYEIPVLIRKLKSVYEGTPWYGDSIKKILKDVDPRIVFDRPIAQAHCIAELLSHMIAWRKLVVKRLEGDSTFSVKQKESFNWRLIDSNPDTAWQSMLHTLDVDYQRIIGILTQSDESVLQKKVPGRRYNCGQLLYYITQHDIYHLGQIALLKKLNS